MTSTRARRRLLALTLVALVGFLATADRSKAQFLGYGGYRGFGFGYPMMGYGYGGFGYPGMMGYGGFAGLGYGGFGYGGFGYGGFGYPGMIGYGGLGYGGYGMAGAYYTYWYNPAILSLGITPLALQSAIMERGLRGDVGFQTALQYTPVARISAPVVIQESQAASAPGGEVVFSSPPQRLPAGTYRVQIIRVDPKDENAMAMPAANP